MWIRIRIHGLFYLDWDLDSDFKSGFGCKKDWVDLYSNPDSYFCLSITNLLKIFCNSLYCHLGLCVASRIQIQILSCLDSDSRKQRWIWIQIWGVWIRIRVWDAQIRTSLIRMNSVQLNSSYHVHSFIQNEAVFGCNDL